MKRASSTPWRRSENSSRSRQKLKLARPAGFEPTSLGFRGPYSDPLSFGRIEFAAGGGGGAAGGRSGEEVVKTVCAACHQAGVANAPKLGDKTAWAPRIKEGLGELVKDAIKGKGAMPPKGGNPSLTDDEVTRAVVLMANQADEALRERPVRYAAQQNRR